MTINNTIIHNNTMLNKNSYLQQFEKYNRRWDFIKKNKNKLALITFGHNDKVNLLDKSRFRIKSEQFISVNIISHQSIHLSLTGSLYF